MKKMLTFTLSVLGFLGVVEMSAQSNCDVLEIKINKNLSAKNYDEAYVLLNEALTGNCVGEKINFYNFGETILVEKLESTKDSVKYGKELIDLIDKRLAHFPEDEGFWRGEQINYKLKYKLVDKLQAYKEYKALFSDGDKEKEKLSSSTVLTYYLTALELMQEGTLDFEEILEVYFQTKKVAEDNIEMRSNEYGELAEKLEKIKAENPNKDLSPSEKERMANAQAAKDIFVDASESMEAVLADYTTCENVAPMYVNKFEANKDSIEWVIGAYQALASKECFDQPIMEKLEARYVELWKKQNPQSTATPGNGGQAIASKYGSGARKFKAGNYSGAIQDFTAALDEVSGRSKGDVAYYIALSYQKTGSLSNAVSWAKRAANYKPGWGAPYQLIASIFGASANSCGSSQFEKLSTYWVAADYANKACAVDSRSCGWARKAAASYEATAPNSQMIFSQGKSKGQTVSVSCFGGATTRIR